MVRKIKKGSQRWRKMKRIKKDRVKRGRIILSAILTFALAILSLGFGGYLGYVTLNINYVTIGTMTTEVGGLLVVAGFFIFFGCIGGVISLKELFIAHRNEDKFSAYKGSLISAIVFYCVIALISVIGIVSSFISYVPSNFTWGIIGLGFLSLVLSAGCFYCVFKELKEHKKKKKNTVENQNKQTNQNSDVAFNMNLDANEIHKFSNMTPANKDINQYQNQYDAQNQQREQNENRQNQYENYERQSINQNNQRENLQNVNAQGQNGYREWARRNNQMESNEQVKNIDILGRERKNQQADKDLNFVSLAEQLMQLEELRKAGLINDQEYQELKRKCIL